MPKVYLADLKPGMKLSKPVTNPNGLVLLPEGCELNEEHLARLQKMEIEWVFTRGGNQPDKPLEDLLAEVETRFKKTGQEAHMAELKRAFQEHLAGLYETDGL